jgi:hypothetical protein
MKSIIEVDPAGHYSYFIEIGIVRIKGVNTRPNVSNLPEVRATLSPSGKRVLHAAQISLYLST